MNDDQMKLPYPDEIGKIIKDENINTLSSDEGEKTNYLTKDGSEVDPRLVLGMYHAFHFFNETGKDTFTAKDVQDTLIELFVGSKVPDKTYLHSHLYSVTFPNIKFLEMVDSEDPNDIRYRILQKEFEEFSAHSGLQEAKKETDTSRDTVESIKPSEILPENIGLYALLEEVLSDPNFEHYPLSDNPTEIYYGAGSLTYEPLITVILIKCGLDTQKYRWKAKEIFDTAGRNGMLDTLQPNKKEQKYYVLNFAFKLPEEVGDGRKKTELENFIGKIRSEALIGKQELSTIASDTDKDSKGENSTEAQDKLPGFE